MTEEFSLEERTKAQADRLSADQARGTKLPGRLRAYLYLALISGTIVLLDQWTKGLVRSNLPQIGDRWIPWEWLAPYARIVHWQNKGAAFGMFQDFSVVFTILPILVAGAIIYYFPQVPRSDWSLRLAMGLQLGGALGNLIDRLTIGQVTDFISVGSFPVFNVADASISIGVVVLAFGMWWQGRRDRNDTGKSRDTASTLAADPVVARESNPTTKRPGSSGGSEGARG